MIEGDKERQQKFKGDVINVRGSGVRKTFTVRKISEGIGVERTFPVSSPSIAEIKVLRHSKVRRAKLFYLRTKTGKSARLTEKKSIETTAKGAKGAKGAKSHKAEKKVTEAVTS